MIDGGRMAVPLGRTPAAFRWWWAVVVPAAAVSQLAIARWAPGSDLRDLVREPGALVLLVLVLVAELYPALPSIRRTNPFEDFVLSTPLIVAAVVAFGPHAAVVLRHRRLRDGRAVRPGVVARGVEHGTVGTAGAAAAGVLWLLIDAVDVPQPMSSGA